MKCSSGWYWVSSGCMAGLRLKKWVFGMAQLNGSLAASACHTSRLAIFTLVLLFLNIAVLILENKVHTGSRFASRQCVNSMMNTEWCQRRKTLVFTLGMTGYPFLLVPQRQSGVDDIDHPAIGRDQAVEECKSLLDEHRSWNLANTSSFIHSHFKTTPNPSQTASCIVNTLTPGAFCLLVSIC